MPEPVLLVQAHADADLLRLRQLDTWRWEEHQRIQAEHHLWLLQGATTAARGPPTRPDPSAHTVPSCSTLVSGEAAPSSDAASRIKAGEVQSVPAGEWSGLPQEGSGESVGEPEPADRWLLWLEADGPRTASPAQTAAASSAHGAESAVAGEGPGALAPHLQLVQRWKAMQAIDDERERRSATQPRPLARQRSGGWGSEDEVSTRKRERGRPRLLAAKQEPGSLAPLPNWSSATRQPLSVTTTDLPATGDPGRAPLGGPPGAGEQQHVSPASLAAELRRKRWRGPQELGNPAPLAGPRPGPPSGTLARAFNSLQVQDRGAGLEARLGRSLSLPSSLPVGLLGEAALSQFALEAAHELERRQLGADDAAQRWGGAGAAQGGAPGTLAPGLPGPVSFSYPGQRPLPQGSNNPCEPPRAASLLAALPDNVAGLDRALDFWEGATRGWQPNAAALLGAWADPNNPWLP